MAGDVTNGATPPTSRHGSSGSTAGASGALLVLCHVNRGQVRCRYADDGLVHCRNEQEAQTRKADLQVARCGADSTGAAGDATVERTSPAMRSHQTRSKPSSRGSPPP